MTASENAIVSNAEAINAKDIKSARIIYNPYNIDSAYAVCLVAERLKYTNNDIKITSTPYDFAHFQMADEPAELLIICGATIFAKDLFQEIQQTGARTVVHFQYENYKSESLNMTNEVKYLTITPHTKALEQKKQGDDYIYNDHVAENCISVIANDFFANLGCGTTLTDEQKRLMMVISSYINFMQFDSIFVREDVERSKGERHNEGRIVRRHENDLVFLYQNMQGIRDYAARGQSYPVRLGAEDDHYEFRKELSMIRRLITRNMNEQVYAAHSSVAGIPIRAKTIQTTCVGEENAVEVMRQLSYAFSTIITYEDIQGYRIWRILCNDPDVIALLRNALEPQKEWVDCRITYFASEPLKRERK